MRRTRRRCPRQACRCRPSRRRSSRQQAQPRQCCPAVCRARAAVRCSRRRRPVHLSGAPGAGPEHHPVRAFHGGRVAAAGVRVRAPGRRQGARVCHAAATNCMRSVAAASSRSVPTLSGTRFPRRRRAPAAPSLCLVNPLASPRVFLHFPLLLRMCAALIRRQDPAHGEPGGQPRGVVPVHLLQQRACAAACCARATHAPAVFVFLTVFLGFFLFGNFTPAVNYAITTLFAAGIVVLVQA